MGSARAFRKCELCFQSKIIRHLGDDSLTAPYIKIGNYEAEEVGGKRINMYPDQDTIKKINEVGSICWSLLDEVQSIDSMSRALMEKLSSDVSMKELRNEIEKFLLRPLQCELNQHND